MNLTAVSLASVMTLLAAVACMPTADAPAQVMQVDAYGEYVNTVPTATAAAIYRDQLQASATAAMVALQATQTAVAPQFEQQYASVRRAEATMMGMAIAFLLPVALVITAGVMLYLRGKWQVNRALRITKLMPLQMENEHLESQRNRPGQHDNRRR